MPEAILPGRRDTDNSPSQMMLGFSGYLIFGLIIGCAYEKVTGIIPLFIVL